MVSVLMSVINGGGISKASKNIESEIVSAIETSAQAA